jgi:hypothetical protein
VELGDIRDRSGRQKPFVRQDSLDLFLDLDFVRRVGQPVESLAQLLFDIGGRHAGCVRERHICNRMPRHQIEDQHHTVAARLQLDADIFEPRHLIQARRHAAPGLGRQRIARPDVDHREQGRGRVQATFDAHLNGRNGPSDVGRRIRLWRLAVGGEGAEHQDGRCDDETVQFSPHRNTYRKRKSRANVWFSFLEKTHET